MHHTLYVLPFILNSAALQVLPQWFSRAQKSSVISEDKHLNLALLLLTSISMPIEQKNYVVLRHRCCGFLVLGCMSFRRMVQEKHSSYPLSPQIYNGDYNHNSCLPPCERRYSATRPSSARIAAARLQCLQNLHIWDLAYILGPLSLAKNFMYSCFVYLGIYTVLLRPNRMKSPKLNFPTNLPNRHESRENYWRCQRKTGVTRDRHFGCKSTVSRLLTPTMGSI